MKVKWKMRIRQRRKFEMKKEYRKTMRVNCEVGTKKMETHR